MSKIKLTIQHQSTLIEPPIEEGVKIEWERTGSPGKLTFTTVKLADSEAIFGEGDQVCFYYDEKLVFVGYVFSKKRSRDGLVDVTCYDQIRYLKNKYTYVFEKKTATQIVKSLCNDFGLQTGSMDNTSYVIPAIAEENKAALDIILDVLEETLLNTGDMFVLFDEAGKLQIKNVANMTVSTWIMEETAEDFDYTSSIDSETYNNIVLYYKQDDKVVQYYTASSPTTIKQWGMLRYFEEVKTPTIGQNKANGLLKLYNKKTRELSVSGAFGDINVRGGTLIPTTLNLGDVKVNNHMLVERVTHKFEKDHHTMDLTLQGRWEDGYTSDMVSKTIGEISETTSSNSGTSSNYSGYSSYSSDDTSTSKSDNYSNTSDACTVTVNIIGGKTYSGTVTVKYSSLNRKNSSATGGKNSFSISAIKQSGVLVEIIPKNGHSYVVESVSRGLSHSGKNMWSGLVGVPDKNMTISIRWVR